MNENEVCVCNQIFQTIIDNPLSRLFWTSSNDVINPAVLHPLNLEDISIRLSKGKYIKPDDFVKDMNLCLVNGINGSVKGTIRNAAATELKLLFDHLVLSLQPLAHPNTLPLKFITSKFENENALPEIVEHEFDSKKAPQEPQSELFKLKSDPNDVVTLLRDIKLLTSIDLTMKLAVLIRDLQPDVITVGDVLSFNVGLMTEETRIKVRKYVTELLRESASGQFDPFLRPFGTYVDPITIQERGMFLRTPRTPLNDQQNES